MIFNCLYELEIVLLSFDNTAALHCKLTKNKNKSEKFVSIEFVYMKIHTTLFKSIHNFRATHKHVFNCVP